MEIVKFERHGEITYTSCDTINDEYLKGVMQTFEDYANPFKNEVTIKVRWEE